MNEYLKLAEEKLIREHNNGGLSNHAKVVAEELIKALLNFATQEPEFAQAIAQSDKSFAECCNAVVKDVKNHISDIEAYRRAVQFYFPGADIRFEMKIDLCASVNSAEPSKTLDISLMDLLG